MFKVYKFGFVKGLRAGFRLGFEVRLRVSA